MANSVVTILALFGALLLAVVAIITAMGVGRSRRQELAAAGGPAEERSPRDLARQKIVALVTGESGGQITARAGQRPAAGVLPAAPEVHLSREVATGLQTICQAIPEVGAHPSNIILLTRLREVTGANDFRFLCGQLASVLNNPDPRYHDLAAGLQSGDLSWSEFLAQMRSIPMGAARS
jgi:hypothetical protein